MGQRANSNRNASLDQEKRRSAGRANTNSPERRAIRDAAGTDTAKGAAGAFGKQGRANRRGAGLGSDAADVRPARRKAH